MTLGQRIAQYRREQGLSQEALGEQLGVSRQAVSKWETDGASPDMGNLLGLSRVFDVTLADLTQTPEERPAPVNPEIPAVPANPFRRSRRRTVAFLGAALAGIAAVLALVWAAEFLRFQPESPEVREARETGDPTRAAFLAWKRLETAEDLTPEEVYENRRTIFQSLSGIDWTAFGAMENPSNPDGAIFDLLGWMDRQGSYTAQEVWELQSGCASNLDGAYAERYGGLLANALFANPAVFVQSLARDPDQEDIMGMAVSLAASDAVWQGPELDAAVIALDQASREGMFSRQEDRWRRFVLAYLDCGDGDFSALPRTPAEMEDREGG